MSVVTPPAPERDFSRVRNSWMRDPNLTWADKGMLAYIAGHALEHPLTMEQIIAEGAEGADAVRTILRRLERAGWLKRTPVRGFRGRVIRYDFMITIPSPVVDLTGLDSTASGPTASGEAATSHDLRKEDVTPGPTACRPTASSEPGTKKTTPPSEEKKTTEKTRGRATRGTRLPKDWTPPDELMAWFLAELVEGGRWSAASREAVRREHAQFSDWWEAVPGVKGEKKDWVATWRVWMRRAFPRPIPAGDGPAPQTGRKSFAEQDLERRQHGDRRAAAIDALMEANPGLTVRDAARQVDAELARRVDERTAGTYIEVDATDVVTDGGREVAA